MALLHSTESHLNSPAPDFSLMGTDGRTYSLKSFQDRKGLLAIFMCNHCPYVIAVEDRINQIAKDYPDIAVIGINSNDPHYKNDDSFENMVIKAKNKGYVFPYVIDETQQVARDYDAVCTPDPYLFKNMGTVIGSPDFRLQYRGRIDDSWKDESKVTESSLRLAINRLLNQQSDQQQNAPAAIPSMGCSIKWKELTIRKG
jgi:peroxiredoxin